MANNTPEGRHLLLVDVICDVICVLFIYVVLWSLIDYFETSLIMKDWKLYTADHNASKMWAYEEQPSSFLPWQIHLHTYDTCTLCLNFGGLQTPPNWVHCSKKLHATLSVLSRVYTGSRRELARMFVSFLLAICPNRSHRHKQIGRLLNLSQRRYSSDK